MGKLVLVEALSQYRMRYCVEVDDNSPIVYACDTVAFEEAKELSQEWLGEVITSHREVTLEEALKIFREDSEYLKDCTDERIIEMAITTLDEEVTHEQ